MRVAITFNLITGRLLKGSKIDVIAELDNMTTINAIKKSLESMGHKAFAENCNKNAYGKLYNMRGKIDMVFNIFEGLHGESRESEIPSMLEMMQIPYTGSDPLSLALCLDKIMTKRVLLYHGIPTPRFQVFSTGIEKLDSGMKFPLICKPNHEGSSKGISEKSVVYNKSELRKQAAFLVREYGQEVLVEEFIEGKDLTVAVIGNEKLEFLPILETYLHRYPKKFRVLTYEAKNIGQDDAYFGHAAIGASARRKIYEIAGRAFRATKCRDFCRIDFRLDKNGKPYVLELNPLPGLSPSMESISLFPKAARLAGISYNELIKKMVEVSLKRCGIKI